MSGETGYGITPQGFVMPQLTDLQSDLNSAIEAQFGTSTNTEPESIFGQLSGIFSERLALLWQAMQDVYNSQTPDMAFGASLDNVGALRGIPRLGPTSSVVQNVRLFGTVGTLVPAGTQFNVLNAPTNIFASNAPVTLVAGQSCVQTFTPSAVPAAGQAKISIWGGVTPFLQWNATAATIQAAIRALPFCGGCIVTGSLWNLNITFAGPGTGGLMVQPQFTILESTLASSVPAAVTVIPAIVTPGIDQGNIIATATDTGPIVANAGSLTQIFTPVSGLTNVLNTQDASLGTNVETDTAYRVRMNQELQIAGAGTVEAIRARLLKVTGVTSALVYENVTFITDSHGRPPKSFEAVVAGGTDLDIGNTLWAAKPAGIQTFGNDSQVIVDSQGLAHTMYFSRPTAVPVFLIVNLLVNDNYPADGDVAVQEILANYINGLGQGVNVIVSPQLIAQLATIPGIDDASILAGTAPDPTEPNNIIIEPFEVATAETLDITVNSTPE